MKVGEKVYVVRYHGINVATLLATEANGLGSLDVRVCFDPTNKVWPYNDVPALDVRPTEAEARERLAEARDAEVATLQKRVDRLKKIDPAKVKVTDRTERAARKRKPKR